MGTPGKVLILVVAVIAGGLALGAVGCIGGALFGGNYATDFQFGDARGYEATGYLGAIIGLALGAGLAALLASRFLRRA
jgi:hypothetical protein